MAESFNLKHFSTGESPNRKITVSKIGAIIGTPNSRKLIRSEIELNTQPLIPNNPVVSELIQNKATPPKRTPKKRGRKPKIVSNECASGTIEPTASEFKRVLRSRDNKQ